MTGREFLFLMIGVLIANAAHARRQIDPAKPAPAWDDEGAEALRGRPLRQIPIWPFCLVGAVQLALVDLYILHSLLVGNERGGSVVYLTMGGLAVTGALMGMIGLVLRDEGFPRRMGRKWAAMMGAFREKASVKPKPAGHDLD